MNKTYTFEDAPELRKLERIGWYIGAVFAMAFVGACTLLVVQIVAA